MRVGGGRVGSVTGECPKVGVNMIEEREERDGAERESRAQEEGVKIPFKSSETEFSLNSFYSDDLYI